MRQNGVTDSQHERVNTLPKYERHGKLQDIKRKNATMGLHGRLGTEANKGPTELSGRPCTRGRLKGLEARGAVTEHRFTQPCSTPEMEGGDQRRLQLMSEVGRRHGAGTKAQELLKQMSNYTGHEHRGQTDDYKTQEQLTNACGKPKK